MSVQSRRKPSMLFTATIYGFTWAALLTLMTCCVWGTVTEIRTQTIGDSARSYIAWYFLSLVLPAIIAVCRMGGVEASKRLYLTVQLVNFTVLLGVFRVVLDLAGENGLAFFLGNPVPGVISAYEAFFIWLLFLLGAILQMLSVMNDGYQSRIRSGVGGILFIIGIFLPNTLNSYALLRATCMGLQPNAQCEERVIEMIPVFTMAIAFSAALAVLFFFTMLSPLVARLISSVTGDGTNARGSGLLSDSLKDAEPERNLSKQEPETAVQPAYAEPLPSAVRRNNHFGNFTAAVLGGVVVWAIQAIGERAAKRR